MTGSDTDPVWRRDEIQSPCRNICVIHPESGLCVGCYRTGAEIADWSRMSREARRIIMAELTARAPLITRRPRRGRAARLAEKG